MALLILTVACHSDSNDMRHMKPPDDAVFSVQNVHLDFFEHN